MTRDHSDLSQMTGRAVLLDAEPQQATLVRYVAETLHARDRKAGGQA